MNNQEQEIATKYKKNKKELNDAKDLIIDRFLSDNQKVKATVSFELEFLKELTAAMDYTVEDSGDDYFFVR